ncbi:MAG TPA: ATP-binding protein [Lentisphaerae bacterium]|jgi:predicted AAA+ superfamily ATPase|nr:ATP-binding protein [Lentisphaerota bacterium]
MRTVIERLVGEALTRRIPETVPRDICIKKMAGKVSVLTGMRRTGKTSLCFQTMRELLAAGVARERLLYLNFEDDRLAHVRVGDLQWIVEAFYGANPALKEQTCWFFFDEIQRVDQWELFIRRILDNERVEVMLTGSSAKLLSREIGTAMRGRSLATEVFPLSFCEYCRFQDVHVPERSVYGDRDRYALAKAAEGYLRTGGFPEVQKCEEDIWRTVLQEYADVVILRDVIERHGLGNYAAVKALARHIVQNPGQLLSVTRLAATFSQAGIACGKNLLFDVLDHLHDAFFCFPVEVHDRSLNRRQVNPKKVYAADTGLCRAFSSGITGDRGAALEGVVFTTLRAGGFCPDYVVTPQKTGVDFVYKDGDGWQFVQACWSLADAETAAREFRGLADALPLHPKAGRTLVTWNEEGERDGVRIVPLWRWLLEHDAAKGAAKGAEVQRKVQRKVAPTAQNRVHSTAVVHKRL